MCDPCVRFNWPFESRKKLQVLLRITLWPLVKAFFGRQYWQRSVQKFFSQSDEGKTEQAPLPYIIPRVIFAHGQIPSCQTFFLRRQ